MAGTRKSAGAGPPAAPTKALPATLHRSDDPATADSRPRDERPDSAYPWHAAPPPVRSAQQSRPGIQGRRAGLVTRALANTVDAGVVILVLSGGYLAVTAVRFLLDPTSFHFPAPSFTLVVVLGMAVQAVYFLVTWATSGRTYGDGLLGLRVVNFRGKRMRWTGAALRAALCVVFPIGLFWAPVTRQNRSAQDLLLRTSVIYDWPTTG